MTAISHPPSAISQKAIIFDLDGVLIDSEALQHRAYTEVLARFGVRITMEEYAEHWVAAGRGPEYAVRTYGLPIGPDELRAIRSPVYHEILRREVTLMPGAIEAVTRLHPRFPLAIATNSYRHDVLFVVDHFGIQHRFAAIVARDDYERAKPEPDAFLMAAARLGTPPRTCLVVEDAYKGLVAAQRAGARSVAVPNAYTRDNDFSLAAAVLENLDELTVDLVERVLAERSDS